MPSRLVLLDGFAVFASSLNHTRLNAILSVLLPLFVLRSDLASRPGNPERPSGTHHRQQNTPSMDPVHAQARSEKPMSVVRSMREMGLIPTNAVMMVFNGVYPPTIRAFSKAAMPVLDPGHQPGTTIT